MFFSGNYISRIIFTLVFLTAFNLSAEKLSVYRDQYVIEVADQNEVSSANRLADSEVQNLSRVGANLIRKLNKKSRLVSKQRLTQRLAGPSVVEFDPNDTFCEELIASNLAVNCSPNFQIKIAATPNDPDYPQLWGLNNSQGIRAPGAWDVTTGSGQVVVAVIDSGVDYNHVDLKDNLWKNTSEVAGNGIDDDKNGYIDDIYGISGIDSSGDPMDQNGHGTHVSGTIGGKGNNGKGVAGINWNVKIMALKFLGADGSGSLAAAIEVIEYMTMMKQRGVNIVASNNSWGGIGYVQSLYNAIEASTRAGVLFIAAAGNSASNNDVTPSYPASYAIPGLVSVAAIDADQNLASFSSYGLFSVHISAPGVNIYSTFPGNTYRSLSGTSMATPHVTGAIALLRSIDNTSTNESIINRLYETSEPLPSVVGVTYTGRKLNLERLIKNQRTAFTPPSDGSSDCSYGVSEIAYNPNKSADASAIVIQADEYDFHTIDLPFDFPFYGVATRKLIVSPNGVIYTKAKPDSNDYNSGQSAPQNSIAALHTDLTAEVDPNGIRVAVTPTEATIYWRVKHYQGRLKGDLHIRTTVKSSGEISTFLETADLESLAYAKNATIGIRGQNANDINTYAQTGSDLIKNNLGVSFVPSCTVVPPTTPTPVSKITALDAYSINGRGQNVSRVIPGQDLFLNFNGVGTGTFRLNIELDGNVCGGINSVNLVNGVGSLTTKTRRFLSKYQNVQFKVENLTKKLKIKRSSSNQRSLQAELNSRQEYRKIVKKDCQRLLGQVS